MLLDYFLWSEETMDLATGEHTKSTDPMEECGDFLCSHDGDQAPSVGDTGPAAESTKLDENYGADTNWWPHCDETTTVFSTEKQRSIRSEFLDKTLSTSDNRKTSERESEEKTISRVKASKALVVEAVALAVIGRKPGEHGSVSSIYRKPTNSATVRRKVNGETRFTAEGGVSQTHDIFTQTSNNGEEHSERFPAPTSPGINTEQNEETRSTRRHRDTDKHNSGLLQDRDVTNGIGSATDSEDYLTSENNEVPAAADMTTSARIERSSRTTVGSKTSTASPKDEVYPGPRRRSSLLESALVLPTITESCLRLVDNSDVSSTDPDDDEAKEQHDSLTRVEIHREGGHAFNSVKMMKEGLQRSSLASRRRSSFRRQYANLNPTGDYSVNSSLADVYNPKDIDDEVKISTIDQQPQPNKITAPEDDAVFFTPHVQQKHDDDWMVTCIKIAFCCCSP